MRQLTIHHLQGQVLALQCQLTAVIHALPPAIRAQVVHQHQLQADKARVHIISTNWQGQVMPGFEEVLLQAAP